MEIKFFLIYDRKLIWILRLFFISSVFCFVLVDYKNIFIREKNMPIGYSSFSRHRPSSSALGTADGLPAPALGPR